MGVAPSSINCQKVLITEALQPYSKKAVGLVSAEMGLKGKPEPDIFSVTCHYLGASNAEAVVVEDAVSGVQAGSNGNIGLVLGIARKGYAAE